MKYPNPEFQSSSGEALPAWFPIAGWSSGTGAVPLHILLPLIQLRTEWILVTRRYNSRLVFQPVLTRLSEQQIEPEKMEEPFFLKTKELLQLCLLIYDLT